VINKNISAKDGYGVQQISPFDFASALYRNSKKALLLTSTDGSIYCANRTACDLFRMSEEEICLAGRDGLVDLTDPRLNEALLERERNGGFIANLNFRRKDGTLFTAECSSTVIYHNSHISWTAMSLIIEKEK
jgi:PAS domain S-box-containing protein